MEDTGTIWSDRFRDWDRVYGRRGVALLREAAPVPTAPHARVSPADLSYGVPQGVSLREHARSEGIDVASPHFQEPATRNIRCGFFPVLRALQDGSLLAVWREASAHTFCSFGRTVAARSTDGGRSWSHPWVVFALPGAVDAGGPEDLVQAADGTLWMGAWSRVPGQQAGTQGHQIATAYALYSKDNGRTWVTLPPLGDHFYPASPELAMSNGELLWRGSVPAPAEAGLTSFPASVRATLVQRDADAELPRDAEVVELGGLRFERFAHPHLGGPDEEQVTETLIPGTLVMLMRSQGYGEHYFQTTSTDYGRTWSAAVPSLWHSPVPSQPYLITLTDGTLVAVNGQRQNCRIVATASFDNGATWDVAHQQVVLDHQSSLGADFAYPQLTEVADGRLLSIYYSHDHKDDTGERSGIFGTFLETRFFRPAYRGVELAEVGAVRRDSTVAHWRFDEGEGSVAADDRGPHYAKLAGPVWVPGKRGTALRFDGRDDYGYVLECPELRVAREFTVEAWISTEEPERTQTIVSKLPHYWVGLHQRPAVPAPRWDGGHPAVGEPGGDHPGGGPLVPRRGGRAHHPGLVRAGAVLPRRGGGRQRHPRAPRQRRARRRHQRLARVGRSALAGASPAPQPPRGHRRAGGRHPRRRGPPLHRPAARPGDSSLRRPDRRAGAARQRPAAGRGTGQHRRPPPCRRRTLLRRDPAPRLRLGPLRRRSAHPRRHRRRVLRNRAGRHRPP